MTIARQSIAVALASGFLLLAGLSMARPSPAADFDGNGTGDVAVFRAAAGLWSVRDLTRVYLGGTGDFPAPGDYAGDGTDRAGIFRPSASLWSVSGLTRAYFGSVGDEPRIGDYDGDGTEDFGLFRAAAGLWAVSGLTRFYFGAAGDSAIAPGKTKWAGDGIPVTGQTAVYHAGDDGTHQAGAPFWLELVGLYPADWVVLDHRTGLMWAASGTGKGCLWGQMTDMYAAIDYCNNLDFGGCTDWRLPNIKELQSIVNYGRFDPAIDAASFFNLPLAINLPYWSSTSLHTGSAMAWYCDYYAGDITTGSTIYLKYVRAVRAGR